MLTFLKKLRRDERGVSALEYAILAGVVLAAVVVGVGELDFSGIFEKLGTAVSNEVPTDFTP